MILVFAKRKTTQRNKQSKQWSSQICLRANLLLWGGCFYFGQFGKQLRWKMRDIKIYDIHHLYFPFFISLVSQTRNVIVLLTRFHNVFMADLLSNKFTPGPHMGSWKRKKATYKGRQTRWLWPSKQTVSLSVHRAWRLSYLLTQWRLFSLWFLRSNSIENLLDYLSWFIHFVDHVTTPQEYMHRPVSGPKFLLDPKTRRGINLIDYHYETAQPMWLNLTRVQIQYVRYFLKK